MTKKNKNKESLICHSNTSSLYNYLKHLRDHLAFNILDVDLLSQQFFDHLMYHNLLIVLFYKKLFFAQKQCLLS